MASTTTSRETRAVPYTEDRYMQIANALHQMGYEAEANNETNWITVTQPGGLKAWLKVYDTPSKYGIHGGFVSKIQIRFADEWLYNFDRGLDIDELDRHEGARDFFDLILSAANKIPGSSLS